MEANVQILEGRFSKVKAKGKVVPDVSCAQLNTTP
jgi:hypothetical protein